MKIGEVYGHSYNKLLKSISSSGKSMFINFINNVPDVQYLPDVQYPFVNLKLIALIKYKKINDECQTWFDINTNILMSPNHPNNINCSWLITANFGFYIILNFKFIEVNSKSRAYIKLGHSN